MTWQNWWLVTKYPSAANLGVLNQRQQDVRKPRIELKQYFWNYHRPNSEWIWGWLTTGHQWKEPGSVLFASSLPVLVHIDEIHPSKPPLTLAEGSCRYSCSTCSFCITLFPLQPGDLSSWPTLASSGQRIPSSHIRAWLLNQTNEFSDNCVAVSGALSMSELLY